MDAEENWIAAFELLRSHMESWQFGSATCSGEAAGRAFSSTFKVQVYPSFYDYINVGLFYIVYY